MDTSKDGMTDIVERLRADVDINNDFVMSSEEFLEAADEIESLRQQLEESQARDAVRIEALEIASDFLADRMHTAPINRIDRALAMPSDSTALDDAIRKAKREALLEAAKFFDTRMLPYPEDHLRRMADELEEKKA